jgi:hypothetical protein
MEEDDDDVIRGIARYHGHSEADAFAARDLLRLDANGFAVRFVAVAAFARTFGLNIRSLAEVIADYERVHEAEEPRLDPGSSLSQAWI